MKENEMKKIALVTIAFSLTGCAPTLQAPSPPLKYSAFNFGEGKDFTKKNFNLKQYAKRSADCYWSTQVASMSNTTPQQNRYQYCMQNSGYELSSLSVSEIKNRKKATQEKITKKETTAEKRRYSEEKIFDKPHFNDDVFVADARDCTKSSAKQIVKKHRVTPIYSPNFATYVFNSFFAGVESASLDKKAIKKAQINAFNWCMIDKGYTFETLTKEEKDRRTELIKNASKQ